MSLIKTYIRKSSEFINVRRRGQHCNDNMTMENITLLSGQGTSWCRGKYIEPDQNLRLALLFILRLFLLSWKDMRGKCRNVRVKYMGDSKVLWILWSQVYVWKVREAEDRLNDLDDRAYEECQKHNAKV